MDKTCKTCRWWVPSEKLPAVGDCHRYPPTVNETDDDCFTRFPFTDDVDFCGEHEATPNPKPKI